MTLNSNNTFTGTTAIYDGKVVAPAALARIGLWPSPQSPADGDAVFSKILVLTDLVLNNQDEDLTDGAVNYHDASVHPSWADPLKRSALILPFSFYKL